MSKTKFTKADVQRACAGAREAGIEIACVEMLLEPRSIKITPKGSAAPVIEDDPEELRKLL